MSNADQEDYMPYPSSPRGPSRGSWPVRTTVAVVVMGLATQAGAQGLLDTIRNIGNAIQAATGASAPAGQPQQQPLAPVQRPNTGNATLDRALGPAQGAPMTAPLAALFRKGTVTGVDLFETLKGIKLEAQAKRSAAAWAKLNVALDQTVAQLDAGQMPNFDSLLGDVAFKFMEEQLKSMVATVGMQALDEFMATLMEDTDGLAAETVALPAAVPGMTDAQAKRVVNMAAMIVAARMTTKALDAANKNLSQLQTDYAAIIKQREEVANVLYELIDKRRQAQRSSDAAALAEVDATLKASLTPQDIQFIDLQLLSMKADVFAKDMAAQNMALEVVKRLKPDVYKDYRAKTDDAVARTRAYVKTVTGAAAFGGLMLNFSQQMAALGREKNVPNILQAMPLGLEFVRAAYPAAELSVKSSLNGFVLQPANTLFGGLFGGAKPNWVVTNGDKREELKDAAAVFQWIDKQGMKPQFSGALFRSETLGWLGGVHRCDAAETGRMLDSAVPRDQRTGFAKAYLRYEDAEGFSFMNALTLPPKTDREQRLARDVLQADHRQNTRNADPTLLELQNTVSDKYPSWSNPQLLRLVFGNREGPSAAQATLEVGPLTIRPVPSADSVYAYESHTESCRLEEVARLERERASGAARRQVRDTSASSGAPAAAGPAAAGTNPATSSASPSAGGKKPATTPPNTKPPTKPAGTSK